MKLGDLTERYERRIAEGPRVAPALGRPVPTATHRKVIEVTDALLAQCAGPLDDSVPATIRAMVRSFQKLKPTILDELATVPEDRVREALRYVRSTLDSVLD